MRQIQGTFFTGYVTISVAGAYPERFFNKLVAHGISVWNMKKESATVCSGNIRLRDISKMRQLRRRSHYKITFTAQKGFPVRFRRFKSNTPFVLSLCVSLLLIVVLSNLVWKVEITNVPKELEEKIYAQLDHYGVHEGAWALSLDEPSIIQRKLIEDIPELLWIGVHKKGTTYFLEGVEKIVVEEEAPPGPRNLVARKSGVIEKVYVSKGLPKVRVNDYVEKGDILVSGELGPEEREDDENDDTDKPKTRVAADGEIIAKTWYETTVTIPLDYINDQLTGDKTTQYSLSIGSLTLPIWGFKQPDYEMSYEEVHNHDIYVLKWKLPIEFNKTVVSETERQQATRTKQEAIKKGIAQAQKELQLKIGPQAEIISKKILHESTEHGKVKLILYLTVEEDISEIEPLTQGD
ncbi:sporulation protein YqfD [Lentibacillus saliphilus]|uniref:sporulation protein YqfD n=1 Tax=Lentibacillus saliphilus TaxID=2737028 RepID=UPI001C2FA3DE|nr:sporulation protein YqfD [Lentibacillus saliphilus]